MEDDNYIDEILNDEFGEGWEEDFREFNHDSSFVSEEDWADYESGDWYDRC